MRSYLNREAHELQGMILDNRSDHYDYRECKALADEKG
jgi:hypothetical protein